MTTTSEAPIAIREFGVELKVLRLTAGLSQSKLAQHAGFDHSYVSRLESGARDPTREAVDRLCEALKADEGQRRRLLASAAHLNVIEANDLLIDLSDDFTAAAMSFAGSNPSPELRAAMTLILKSAAVANATDNVISRTMPRREYS